MLTLLKEPYYLGLNPHGPKHSNASRAPRDLDLQIKPLDPCLAHLNHLEVH
jgi:hypothetical protein